MKRDSFGTCGGGGRAKGREITLALVADIEAVPSSAGGPADAITRAKIESMAGRALSKDECTYLRGVLDAAAGPGADGMSDAHAERIVRLAVDPCLTPSVVSVATRPLLSGSVPSALERLVPDPSERLLVLLRIIGRGEPGLLHAGSSIVRAVPESHRSLLVDGLRRMLVGKKTTPGARANASMVLAEVTSLDEAGSTVLETATRLTACGDRTAFIEAHDEVVAGPRQLGAREGGHLPTGDPHHQRMRGRHRGGVHGSWSGASATPSEPSAPGPCCTPLWQPDRDASRH